MAEPGKRLVFLSLNKRNRNVGEILKLFAVFTLFLFRLFFCVTFCGRWLDKTQRKTQSSSFFASPEWFQGLKKHQGSIINVIMS